MTDLAPEVVSEPGGNGRPAKAATGSARSAVERGRDWLSRRWVQVALEVVVSIAAALGYTLLCRHISVNPLNRIGQVSGLAKMQVYVAVLGLPLLGALLYTAYRGSLLRHQLVKRLVCAALAGLSTGVVAGGVVVALRGTPWPLGGQEGDPSVLIDMATSFMDGKGMSGVYPPGFPAAMAALSELRYGGRGGAGFALHDLQILCSALVGPMSYLAWRLLLRPFWALLIAVPAAVVFLDPIRPYSHVVMIVLVPLLAAFLRALGRIGESTGRSALLRGLGFGVVFGLLFLWYSGWYLWSAPGVLVLALFAFPWRKGRAALTRGALYAGAALAGFVVVGSPLLYQIVRLGASTPDRYAYITVYADPAYVMGWMSDRSGTWTVDNWPVAGELAGQTGFALLLLLGVGLGLGLGLRHIATRTAAAVLVGAWLLRFYYAGRMAHDKQIQLYPRTTWIIMYCLMIMAVLGIMALVNRGSGWGNRVLAAKGSTARVIPLRVVQQVAAGMVCMVALFATMGASWSVNRYMPEDQAKGTMGMDAWRAHTIKKQDGKCPKFTPVTNCADPIVKDWQPTGDDGYIWCAGIVAADWKALCGRKAPFDDLSTKPKDGDPSAAPK
ncbi:hypothetical protein AB0K43_03990 [Kitasatospora sp. NPDC049258]|uniref:hypothetical protein n=1 Tax=Kitasatospora sp. NPDC049258 TaxID=3155394 RepID=UPI0034182F78